MIVIKLRDFVNKSTASNKSRSYNGSGLRWNWCKMGLQLQSKSNIFSKTISGVLNCWLILNFAVNKNFSSEISNYVSYSI